ncbi:MAG: FHA domain-containing protein [Candidatus Eisenbacteria bacterium]
MALRVLLTALGVLALGAACVHAQALGTLRMDDVRVDSRGRHRVLVSALDANGSPIADLESHFSARLDGQAIAALTSEAARKRQPGSRIIVVVDATLFGGETLSAVQDALRGLLPALSAKDELDVIGVGHSLRRRNSSAARAGHMIDGLGSLADADTPVLYDALYVAARDAARLPADHGSVLLLVTRGSDGGSHHTQIQVLAMARSRARLTPVLVTLVGDEGAASEADPLQRLAQHTAGGYGRVGSPADLASALAAQLERGLQRYVLTFGVAGYDPKVPRHTLEVTVAQAEDSRRTEREYLTAEVLPLPWWRSPLPWLIVLGLLVLGGAAFFLSRRHQLCLLVHDGDEQDGIWYEVFALPVTLGGAEGNDILFADTQVSRNHAVLERRGRNIELVDLNSENGTLVNGERITRRVLAEGDRISLGDAVHLLFEARS